MSQQASQQTAIPPPITVSVADFQKIEALLEMPAYRKLPGIAALQSELDRANVVDVADMPAEVVAMHSTVRFIDDLSKQEFSLTLVYPQEAGSPDSVSVLAPVGSALLGLSPGQTIAWQVPGVRSLSLRVLSVQPPA